VAFLVNRLGGEAGVGDRRRDNPIRRDASYLALFKAWIGDFGLGEYNVLRNEAKENGQPCAVHDIDCRSFFPQARFGGEFQIN